MTINIFNEDAQPRATIHTIASANAFKNLWKQGYGERLIPIVPPRVPVFSKSTIAKAIAAGKDNRGKVPGIKWANGEWSSFAWLVHQTTESDCERWHTMGAGTGIRTGNGLVAIDVDITNRDQATEVKEQIERRWGLLPSRIGQPPKNLFVVRTDPDMEYARLLVGADDRIEILSSGKQFVAFGIHPKEMRPYNWVTQLPDYDQLRYVPKEELLDFLACMKSLLPNTGTVEQVAGDREVDQSKLKGDPELIKKAVASIPNDDQYPAREDYLHIGYAIKASLPDDEDLALELFQQWCSRWTAGQNDPEIVDSDWRRMKPPFKVGSEWLYREANTRSGGVFNATRWFEPLEEEEHLFPFEPRVELEVFTDAQAFNLTRDGFIKARDFLYGYHYLRNFMSVTVAPTKLGKSSLIIAEVLAQVTGLPLLGVKPNGSFNCLIWNGEDPYDEIVRRVRATMQYFNLTDADLKGSLYIVSGRDHPINLAREGRNGPELNKEAFESLKKFLLDRKIDIAVFDPLVKVHTVNENDNMAMDLVSRTLNKLAGETNASVELVHHVRKGSGNANQSATIEDGRGASAIISAARSARRAVRMTLQEGKAYLGRNFKEHRRYFRFSDADSNLAIADPDENWFELRSVEIQTGYMDGQRYIPNDRVGVVTRRGEMTQTDITGLNETELEDAENALLDGFKSGDWRVSPRAKEKWAGCLVASVYGLDEEEDRLKIKVILDNLSKSGKIKKTKSLINRNSTEVYVLTESVLNKINGGLFD